MTTTIDNRALDEKLNELITAGKALEGFERFYASDVEMIEGGEEPVKGKDVNRKREEEFFGSVADVHQLELLDSAVEGDTSYSTWAFDLTFKDGSRVAFTQVARRDWEDGKIVREQFFKAA